RLAAIGLRPISALVDITNFLTFDVNRPLHAFDFDKLQGDLAVRGARPGEMILALNGKTYELDSAVTVIADNDGVQGLGGVIGSEASGCTEITTAVLLEAAPCDPIRTAATGRRPGVPMSWARRTLSRRCCGSTATTTFPWCRWCATRRCRGPRSISLKSAPRSCAAHSPRADSSRPSPSRSCRARRQSCSAAEPRS